MGRCTDYVSRSKKGTVVKKDDKLKLLVEGSREQPCSCHSETCTHFSRTVSINYNEYFEINNNNNIKEGQVLSYEFFYKGDGVKRVNVA